MSRSPATVPLTDIPGVGPRHVEMLGRMGLVTVEDLLNFAPRRHEDRRHLAPLSEAKPDEHMTVRGRIHRARSMPWHGRPVFEAIVAPLAVRRAEEIVKVYWFGRYDLARKLTEGTEIFLYGKLTREKSGGWKMSPTEFEIVEEDGESYIHIDRLTPIYALTEGLYARVMRRIMFYATQKLELDVSDIGPAPDVSLTRAEAYRRLHFPESWEEATQARQRLAFDEFLVLQCIVAQRRLHHVRVSRDRPAETLALAQRWLASLSFRPTGAQLRVMREIDHDFAQGPPMNRLLQGDVGSGKTLVAVYAMLKAVERGEQAALMAPTQILAEQHALNLRRWLEPLGIEVQLFTGNQKPSSRLQKLQGTPELFAAEAYAPDKVGSVIIGTHALLFDRYAADKLGLIVIDEQHKFGVLQRLALSRKGQNPDILVMTATPIPRTLGLTLYGDLDCSVLDELPPGRQPIKTVCRSAKQLTEFWKFFRDQIEAGRQGYVIYPLVEESEKVEAKSVKAEYERLKEIFPGVNLGLLHGQLPAPEKERVMEEFRAGRAKILVSTSVVEVGVDVPNATVMLIENAERFGLAQLHQLRGRIGRGQHPSYCVLVGEAKSVEGWRRLKIMEKTTDGFLIAEEDMDIRGEGNFLGTEQSGMPPLRFGRLKRDFAWLMQAKEVASKLTEQDPKLLQWPLLKERVLSGGGVYFVAVS